MANSAVIINNLTYQYSGSKLPSLRNINLKIPQGSFFSLIGPSGSGKSTLLTLMRGFQQEIGGNIKGKINILGQNVLTKPISELGKTIGIVFQNPALQLHQLRVIDEVASAPMYQGISYQESQARAFSLIKRFLGKKFINLSPIELSAGQQQKVALAASLSLDPEVLLLDEPFSFLDESADKELMKLLLELNHSGKTIIVSTHDITQIAPTSTLMGLMVDGKLVIAGKIEAVIYSLKLQKAMPPPLFTRAICNLHLDKKFLSWQEISSRVELKISGKKYLKSSSRTLLTLDKVSFTYPESNQGINNVSFQVKAGEIIGLIGSNGSGKTTLAKLILGLLPLKDGKIKLKGKNINSLPTKDRARLIGYVTQDPLDMFFEMNLKDEVAAGPKFLEMSNPKTRAKNTLKQFNLWRYYDKHPDSISGGEKSLLGIADILVNETPILLLDEPEFGLDPGSWERITNKLLKLKSQGKSIIVITQDLEAAFFLCDRIGVMHQGKLIKIGSPLKIFKDNNFLINAGLQPLPFSSLLATIPDKIKLTKKLFLNSLVKHK